ncbi:MarR family transcriptional regulator [uncultured Treponema sp.]|uniref:MarR family winged helix-turn-helix transcriptional regulator n=1 Tax=uncultured Treponema sp. TaxID=162155 RepID=UPI0025D281B0|nr:MarR family transcriptional regulator [uncultured Treponema sp.]
MNDSHKNDIGFLLKKIDEKLEKQVNANLNSLGITFAQIRVLIFVHEAENQQTTQKEIETFLEVSHPTTNGIIKRLEEKQLIKTEMTLKNGRMSKNVAITEKGIELCSKNEADKNLLEDKFTEWLSEDGKNTLRELLLKIYEKLC